jgi:hypothetical protein
MSVIHNHQYLREWKLKPPFTKKGLKLTLLHSRVHGCLPQFQVCILNFTGYAAIFAPELVLPTLMTPTNQV